jgi:hypothetical protein
MGRGDLGIGWQNQEANDTVSVNYVSIVLSTGHADEQLQTNQPAMCQHEGMWAGCNQQSTIGDREVDQRRAQ